MLSLKNFNNARFESSQSYYSLAARDIEREIVAALLDMGVGLLAYSPLAGGLLSGKFKAGQQPPNGARWTTLNYNIYNPTDVEKAYTIADTCRKIADEKNTTVSQVALAWLLQKKHVTSVIMGVRNVDQLKDNLQAVSITLSVDELELLDLASALKQEYPRVDA
jgi:aryl-alcohol dehydrogenase-like predicted oxidoreductase